MDEKELHDIEVEMRTIDEFGQECKMLKTFRIDGTENGLDASLLYDQFIYFMKMCGYSEETIAHVQWIE